MLGPKNDLAIWRRAQRAVGRLAAAFAADGVEAVIVDGDFLTAADREAFLTGTGANTPRWVTLHIEFDEAKARVMCDPTRTASRDLAFLKKHYDDAALAIPRFASTDLLLDTQSMTVDEAVSKVLNWAT